MDRPTAETEPAPATDALERPDPRAGGLTSEEAQRRLAEQGPNAITEAKGPSMLKRFLANFVQPLELLLWACAVLGLLAKEPALSVAIVLVIVVNAVFSFLEEYKAERSIEALQDMLPVQVHARRDGVEVEIPTEDVVRGDVLILEPGDRVAADADLLGASDLRVDESALTGESVPVEPEEHVYAGTYVTNGTADALVTKTGMDTRFGRIAALSQRTERDRSPLELELDRVTKIVAALAVSIGVVFFIVAGLTGMSLTSRFIFAIGVTVSVVPNGMLPTVTLSLALATQRMAKRNALVRRLSSVETLGETTVICTDKTGTLTANEMTVQRVWTPSGAYDVEGVGYEPYGRFRSDGAVVDPSQLTELLRCCLLCNDARLAQGDQGWSIVGDPTEGALIVLAEKGGLHNREETARTPRLVELPFSSERKRMTTVHVSGDERIAYTKGAAEVILPRTTLDAQARADATAAEAAMEHDALRVLALARRVVPDDVDRDADIIEQDLEFLGLVGMIDPPHPEVPEAIRQCAQAGIRIIMVTGDSPRTAEAIARRIGLVEGDVDVITGPQLAQLDDDELKDRLAERQLIFARIDPEQKLQLATVLRGQGEIVAMTGDGVNDAPALKHADIGIAMGRGGTEVAKQAADLILVDDNFASIVAAVEEGRAVYDDTRRFIGYHFSSNIGELTAFLVWGISGGAVPLPLVVMQVLAIDLGTNQIPAMALGAEPAERGTMTRAPRPRSEHLLNGEVGKRILLAFGPLEALAAMASFLFAYALVGWRPWEHLAGHGSLYVEATTMTFAGIVMAQVGAAQAWRTDRESVRSVGLFSNRLLVIGIVTEIAMVALLAYTPGLQDIFHTGPLTGWEWLFLCIWPPLLLGSEEVRKAVVRRRNRITVGP
jgi:magnesium-transporting ATPase (P-type)